MKTYSRLFPSHQFRARARVWQLSTMLFVLLAMLLPGTAASAAVATPQAVSRASYVDVCWPDRGFPYQCLQWTGSYPSGQVRGQRAGGYSIKVQTCVHSYAQGTSGCSWTNVGSATTAVSTPWYTVGKLNWYRTCMVTSQGGQWNCSTNPRYLGD